MPQSEDRSPQYRKNSLSLIGAVAMGTGVMIGAGIFALTWQVAELARQWFPLAFLAYKGFTTITNSGEGIIDPHRNVGRAIVISISLCLALYLLVTPAIGGNLSIDEIVAARDYALAEAARPAFGHYGLWFTVGFAIVATVSGVIASVFAVSRMLAMLTEMELVPHRHFGMPGTIQRHTLVYTVVIAMALTIFSISAVSPLWVRSSTSSWTSRFTGAY